MDRDEYMAAFRLGVPVRCREVRYRCISAVVCRRMTNKSQPMDAARIYVELELLDNCGYSVTLANPREVEVIDNAMFAAMRSAAEDRAGDGAGDDPDAAAGTVGADNRGTDAHAGLDGVHASEPVGGKRTAGSAKKSGEKRFVKPTADEVTAYCAEKGYTHVDVEAFMAHYEAVGWRVGKNPMKNWRAAVTGWELREKKEGRTARGSETTGSFATDDFFAAAVRRAYDG